MIPRLLLFTLLILASLPMTTLATDFQIDKIVNEALAKAQSNAPEKTASQTSDSLIPVALANVETADRTNVRSLTGDASLVPPPTPTLKTEKTNSDIHRAEEN